MLTKDRLLPLLDRFESKRVLVLGDLMLDEFIWGRVSRISPEAPVPVVEVERESYYPGGAANVARNLRRFASRIAVLGVVGTCSRGEHLKSLLKQENISTEGILEAPEHTTIVKTRIIARHQQVVRVDRECRSASSSAIHSGLLAGLETMLPEIDALIIEDYGKGLLTQPFADAVIRMAKQSGKLVTVDPNPHNPLVWSGVDAIKPNRAEAFAAAGLLDQEPSQPVETDDALRQAAEILRRRWDAQNLLITLGEHGMLLIDRTGAPYHTPTRARQVFDLSGAGDTAIALFTLALSAGAEPWEAAEIANHASGVVVGKLGTETLSMDELVESFEATA